MTDSNKELTTKKLYKTKSITLATFFGGPLAAGYLIGENFKALGERDKGLKSKIIGVIATLILFTTIFSIPEKVMSKVPNSIIPIIYTGLIWFYVEWSQGEFLKKHEENDKSFFSGWRASGIGLICLLIISAGIFSYIYIDSNNPA
ncbi:hypothetical protein BTO05_04800 [Winogradskyella sp. PC-19]|uniref:hypothetical protein n=1 Tax=unclassified Winogradskyella TaxID=2615021 RepID=UPI000B3CA218|nr:MULTISPECIES: hypothetical protein [unclassified Winogradskyella]ARV08983.1 hypothetical protein BTO05_04800 [Winogradskyella sp. PC-19]